MDPANIKRKAIEKGLIKASANLSEKEIFELIFENGFSTKDVASEISGRGVGMNVVKETVLGLNGTYEIFSKIGKGTKFRMKLPLSLSLFNGMCFMNQGQRYVIPSSQVIEIMNTEGVSFRETEKNQQVVQVRNEINRIVDLRKILSLRGGRKENAEKMRDMILIADIDGEKACFRIEQVTGIVRVVQKPISPEMSTCPGSVGVTILGDGNPALILDLRVLWSDLKMKKAV
jgi:two-component system chemotaxis sensor kinase CheA